MVFTQAILYEIFIWKIVKVKDKMSKRQETKHSGDNKKVKASKYKNNINLK
jgi:hypothetical protein